MRSRCGAGQQSASKIRPQRPRTVKSALSRTRIASECLRSLFGCVGRPGDRRGLEHRHHPGRSFMASYPFLVIIPTYQSRRSPPSPPHVALEAYIVQVDGRAAARSPMVTPRVRGQAPRWRPRRSASTDTDTPRPVHPTGPAPGTSTDRAGPQPHHSIRWYHLVMPPMPDSTLAGPRGIPHPRPVTPLESRQEYRFHRERATNCPLQVII